MAKELCRASSIGAAEGLGDVAVAADAIGGGPAPARNVVIVSAREGGIGARGSVAAAAAAGGGLDEPCRAVLLPGELSRRVFSQLDYRDLVQCSLVFKQWHLESTELRQGWKEELYWEACSVRGVHFAPGAPPGLSRYPGPYLPSSLE